jgi:hypothetical protein
MNLAGDGLMLVIAPHELGDREDAYLNASLENFPRSSAFLAPPPRQSPKVWVALHSFAGSAPIDSVASSRGWLAQKRSAYQDARPARRPVSSCRRRAGLLANRGVAPGGLSGAAETRTRRAIAAPAFFGGPRGEFSTVPLQTGLRPVEAPFHETSVTGLRPVGQDCSAAALGPAANAGLSSGALDSLARLASFPTPSTASSSPSALGFGSALLTCCSPLAPAADALEKDGSEERAPPARTTGPRGEPSPAALAARAYWPPVSGPHWPGFSPRCPDLSRWTTPSHSATIASPTHRGARMGEYITSSSVERARRDRTRGTVLSLCSRTSTDALATSQQGLAPDPRCARAGEAQGVGGVPVLVSRELG